MLGATVGPLRGLALGLLVAVSQHTHRGHTPWVPERGWRGAAPPATPPKATAHHDALDAPLVARKGGGAGPDAAGAGAPRRPHPRSLLLERRP